MPALLHGLRARWMHLGNVERHLVTRVADTLAILGFGWLRRPGAEPLTIPVTARGSRTSYYP